MHTTTDHLQDTKLVQFLSESGAELRDVMKLNNAEIEALYSQAYDYYHGGQYEEALHAFLLLTQISHLERRFHFGYAATLQCLGLYMDAIRVYMLASNLDLTDPEPTLGIGYCLLQLKQYREAKNILTLVRDEIASNEDYQLLHAKAQSWLNEIEHLEFK